MTMLQNAS